MAVTAPVEPALPAAEAHSPTLTAADVVDAIVVYFVDEVTVTTPVPVVGAALAEGEAPNARRTVFTVIVEPETEPTWPLTKPPIRSAARRSAPLHQAPSGSRSARARQEPTQPRPAAEATACTASVAGVVSPPWFAWWTGSRRPAPRRRRRRRRRSWP